MRDIEELDHLVESDEDLYELVADPETFAEQRNIVFKEGFVDALEMPGEVVSSTGKRMAMPGAAAGVQAASAVVSAVAISVVALTAIGVLSIEADHSRLSQLSR